MWATSTVFVWIYVLVEATLCYTSVYTESSQQMYLSEDYIARRGDRSEAVYTVKFTFIWILGGHPNIY